MDIDWNRILLNNLPFEFLAEVLFRSAVMFVLLLVTLRLTGKRGVKQLSIFEIVIIISLGSAAGDPMFYEDVGLLPAVVVFFVVIVLYRFVTWLTGKKRWFEHLVEGSTQQLIENGRFSMHRFDRESLAQDEFFTELRMHGVEHLGQVRDAYLETNGEVSVFFFPDSEVKPGLPITPTLFSQKTANIPVTGIYACAKCGQTAELSPGEHRCKVCGRGNWIAAIKTLRIV
jgi:uncharacterized membrane protein YcaP (DUF421 family)